MPRINTYTDNTTIEDDDKLLTYDTQGAATKLTAFSRIWAWVQAKFHALATSSTAWNSNDKMIVDRNGTIARVDASIPAKNIVETYNGSTLAGTAQSVKAAIDGLNSDTYGLDTGKATNVPDNANFNNYTTPGNYYVASATTAGTITNYPPHPANAGTLKVEGTSGSGRKQYFKPWNSPRSYQRSYYNSAWTPWFSTDTVMQYYITTTMGGFDGLDSLLVGMGSSQSYIASVADNGASDGGSNSRPTTNNFWLVFGTINANGKYAQQLAMSFDNNGNIYRRTRSNSDTWSAWKTFTPS